MTQPRAAAPAKPKFTPKPVHKPKAYVPAAGEVQKVVHIKDIVKCDHGGKVNLDPTEERNTEIQSDLRIVTDQDLLKKVTISGCSQSCTKITSITKGLSTNLELKGGTIPVLRNLEAVSDKGCIVTWKNFEFDIDAAVKYADDNAESGYKGYCARYVQNALREGLHQDMDGANAKDLGPVLKNNGFTEISSGTVAGDKSVANPQKGDVVVFDAVDGHEYGHVAIWDGKQWVSDTKQAHFSANQADYLGGRYKVYRSAGYQAHALPQ